MPFSYLQKPDVAIIIPVYNVERYVRICLDSLLKQTLHNILIICIDDGSTDTSPKILKEYQKRDNRIHVITQENQGQGKARNRGIEYALQYNPTYIGFVDSDDFVAPTMYEKLYTKAMQFDADIAYCDVMLYNNTTQEQYIWTSSTPPLLPVTQNRILHHKNTQSIFSK